ncbi:MAG: FAD-dependent oxidoreductase [Caldilineaceae bacterium]
MRGDLVGTRRLAKYVYVREARRIQAEFIVTEEHVGTGTACTAMGSGTAAEFHDTVGTGSYRIDLHPSTKPRTYVDVSSLPFQIPLGALIPVRMENMLPACKNLGVTHITNGCYRLHPVE